MQKNLKILMYTGNKGQPSGKVHTVIQNTPAVAGGCGRIT